MIIKRKCDCCGRMLVNTALLLIIVAKKEFDGLACTKCAIKIKELK
jgi:hypothetical protein